MQGATGPALDAGCGPGLLLAALRAHGMEAVGADLSPAMARQAAAKGPSVAATMERLPFADDSFGLVIAAGAVEYVADDRAALAELVRILRSGGVLLATFPNRRSPYRIWKNGVFYPLVDLLRPFVYRLRGRPAPANVTAFHHAYREGLVRETLRELGCDAEDVVFLNMQMLPSPLDEWLPSLSVAISRSLEGSGRTRIGRIGTAFLVRAVKHKPNAAPRAAN
jgi:SAM-dependent methyltransferase